MFSFLMWSYLFAGANAAQIGEYARVFSLPAVNDSVAMDTLGTVQVGSSLFVGLNPSQKTNALVVYFFDLSKGADLTDELEAIGKAYSDKNVHLVLICTESGPLGPISSWVSSNVESLTVLRDKYQIVKSSYSVSNDAEAFVIDPLGRIFSQKVMRSNSDIKDLKQDIDELVHQSEMGEITPKQR